MIKPYLYFVRLPEQLCQDDIANTIGMGLYLLLSGNRPEVIPVGEISKKRVTLSEKGQEFLTVLEKSKQFKSKNEIITTALAYMAEQPKWLRATKI